MNLRKLAIVLLLSLNAHVVAAPVQTNCDARLENVVSSFMHIMKSAHQKGEVKREALLEMTASNELTNPFAKSSTLLGPGYRRALEKLEPFLTQEVKEKCKSALSAFLAGKEEEDAVSEGAKEATRKVFKPEQVVAIEDNEYLGTEGGPLYQFEIDKRPMFAKRIPPRRPGEPFTFRIMDPFNSNVKQRMTLLKLGEGNSQESPVAFVRDGETYLAYPSTRQAVNLNKRKTASRGIKFAELAMQPPMLPMLTTAGGQIHLKAEFEAKGVNLSDPSGKETYARIDFSAYGEPAPGFDPVAFRHGDKTLVAIAYTPTRTKIRRYILISDLHSGEKFAEYNGTHPANELGLAYHNGTPILFFPGGRDKIVLVNALTGEPAQDMLAGPEAAFNEMGQVYSGHSTYIVFAGGEGDEKLLEFQDISGAGKISIPTDLSGINKTYSFSYLGNNYLLVASSTEPAYIFKLESEP